MVVPGDGFGAEAAVVAITEATVIACVGVEDFLPVPVVGYADAEALPKDGGKATGDGEGIALVGAFAKEAEGALIGVGAIDPLEGVGVDIAGGEAGDFSIDAVEVAYGLADAFVIGELQKVPVEGAVVTPFAGLPEVATHEECFLARPKPHEAVEAAKLAGFIGDRLAGHFVEHGAFAVDDFVVGVDLDEVFGVLVEHTEGELMVLKLPVYGVLRHVGEGVVHPAHVPLEVEAEAAVGDGLGDSGKGGGLFGDHECAGVFLVDGFVDCAEKVDGLKVFASAIAVGDPLPFFARVVEVEHRGDGVDAESVDVVALAPGKCAGDEKGAYFVAPVVKDEGAPVLMKALTGIGVFVECGAVEVGQGKAVCGEVSGYPIHDDAEAVLVEDVD